MSTTTTRRTPALVGALALTLLAGCGEAQEPAVGTSAAEPQSTATQNPTATKEGAASAPADATAEDSGGAEETTAAQETATGPIVAPPPADDVAQAGGSGCTPESEALPDGRWFGEVTQADGEAVTFNLMCWFEGPDADLAAQEDGLDPTHVTDGYYLRDDNPELRTVPVQGDAKAVHYPDGWPREDVTLGYPEWAQVVTDGDLLFAVWLVVEGGEVTGIEEQWVP